MHNEVLVAWLAACFGVMAAALAVTAVLVSWPVLLVALPLGGMALFLWYHASGRLHERMESSARRQRARRQDDARRAARAGVGAAAASPGPGRRRRNSARAEARTDGFGSRHAARSGQAGFRGGPGAGSGRAGPAGVGTTDEMSRQRARSILDLDPDANQADVRSAYRRKVKEVHPDRGGDTESFVRVTDAYERLGGDA